MITGAMVRGTLRRLRSDKHRLLTQDEEQLLARAYHAGIERQECLDMLVWRNLGLAKHVAMTYARPEHIDDALAAAIRGLIRAVEGFDPDRGLKFATYAMYWCRQCARRYVSSHQETIRVPEYMVYKTHKVRRAWATLCQANGTPPSMADMETYTGLDAETIALARRTMRLEPKSLDDPEDTSIAQALTESAEDISQRLHEHDDLHEALMQLDGDARSILIRHFGLDGRTPETLQSIAMTYGVTRQRIEQRVASACKKLHKILA